MLSDREIRRGLKTKSFGNKIYTFDTIDSTNNCVRALANVGAPEGIVVFAEEQTAGRGRLGRAWVSKPKENLMFSLLIRPQVQPEALNLLPLYVGVAVAQAIEKVSGLEVECKWPNDLLVNKRKVAGILIESAMSQSKVDFAVIGVGINVNQSEFPPDLCHKATSLFLAARKQIDRAELFREILAMLERHYTQSSATGFQSIVPFWQQRSSMINKPIIVSQAGSIVSGVVKGLSKEGGLVLRVNGSEKTLFAGDVTILGEKPEQLNVAPPTQPFSSPI